MHGAEFKDDPSGGQSVQEKSQAENPMVPMFKDPDDYTDMTTEQREEETQRMMGLHKRWSGDAIPSKPKDSKSS